MRACCALYSIFAWPGKPGFAAMRPAVAFAEREEPSLSVRNLTFMGNPVLRRPAHPVPDLDDPAVQALIDDMVETMGEAGGIGLAAPQVGQSLRIIVAMPAGSREELEEARPLVLVDPVLEPAGMEMVDGLEGCLSIPGLRGIVPRHRQVRFEGRDRSGQAVGGLASDLFARILQHEVDHLDGILFLERMADLSRLAMQSEAHYLVAGEAGSPPDPREEDESA